MHAGVAACTGSCGWSRTRRPLSPEFLPETSSSVLLCFLILVHVLQILECYKSAYILQTSCWNPACCSGVVVVNGNILPDQMSSPHKIRATAAVSIHILRALSVCATLSKRYFHSLGRTSIVVPKCASHIKEPFKLQVSRVQVAVTCDASFEISSRPTGGFISGLHYLPLLAGMARTAQRDTRQRTGVFYLRRCILHY